MTSTETVVTDSWPERLRRTPTGILLIVAFLVIVGFGLMFGGAYLLMEQGRVSYWAVATGLVGGAALLYVALQLLRMARWTWLTLIVLVALLAASSVVRLAVAPGVGWAPIGELVVEAAAAYYLTRRPIRARFGWGGRAPG